MGNRDPHNITMSARNSRVAKRGSLLYDLGALGINLDQMAGVSVSVEIVTLLFVVLKIDSLFKCCMYAVVSV